MSALISSPWCCLAWLGLELDYATTGATQIGNLRLHRERSGPAIDRIDEFPRPHNIRPELERAGCVNDPAVEGRTSGRNSRRLESRRARRREVIGIVDADALAYAGREDRITWAGASPIRRRIKAWGAVKQRTGVNQHVRWQQAWIRH